VLTPHQMDPTQLCECKEGRKQFYSPPCGGTFCTPGYCLRCVQREQNNCD